METDSALEKGIGMGKPAHKGECMDERLSMTKSG